MIGRSGTSTGTPNTFAYTRFKTSFFCGIPPRVDHTTNRHAVLGHPLEDDARVQRGALDRREQFVARVVIQIPPERDAAEVGVHENRAVAVVPGEAEQSRLAGPVLLEAVREHADRRARAPRDRLEDVADGGEACLDAHVVRMHRSRHDAADAGHAVGLFRDRDDARARPDDVDDVALLDARADGVPVCVERADRNRNPGAQAEARSTHSSLSRPAMWSDVR